MEQSGVSQSLCPVGPVDSCNSTTLDSVLCGAPTCVFVAMCTVSCGHMWKAQLHAVLHM